MSPLSLQAQCALPTQFGPFEAFVFEHSALPGDIVVLKKDWANLRPWVRIHSCCLTGDVFSSLRCDCQAQLHKAQSLIGQEGGLLIYAPQEGRGIGLANKIKAYALQDTQKFDTVTANEALGLPVDARDFRFAKDILKYFQISNFRLLSNNPQKLEDLTDPSLRVQVQAIWVGATPENQHYLETKRSKLKHFGEQS